mmetsp:Transcript_18732/g.16585  ORF Transcript_18732/g.16585 Transcript_18732/m.16585 type:complete len:100 (+) Transcript_18732:362-661(+)
MLNKFIKVMKPCAIAKEKAKFKNVSQIEISEFCEDTLNTNTFMKKFKKEQLVLKKSRLKKQSEFTYRNLNMNKAQRSSTKLISTKSISRENNVLISTKD